MGGIVMAHASVNWCWLCDWPKMPCPWDCFEETFMSKKIDGYDLAEKKMAGLARYFAKEAQSYLDAGVYCYEKACRDEHKIFRIAEASIRDAKKNKAERRAIKKHLARIVAAIPDSRKTNDTALFKSIAWAKEFLGDAPSRES